MRHVGQKRAFGNVCRFGNFLGTTQFPGSLLNLFFKLLTVAIQLVGDTLFARNVVAETDEADEVALAVVTRCAIVANPAVTAIVVTQPVFHRERAVLVKMAVVHGQPVIQVVRMDAGSPARADFLFQCPAGKVQPGDVEIIEGLVETGCPDQR